MTNHQYLLEVAGILGHEMVGRYDHSAWRCRHCSWSLTDINNLRRRCARRDEESAQPGEPDVITRRRDHGETFSPPPPLPPIEESFSGEGGEFGGAGASGGWDSGSSVADSGGSSDSGGGDDSGGSDS